ncbi:MAG: hypothetical protein HZA54_09835 [Planctomycetes bacterium]|nr:hypothetical protein [Planctomycetota bacterium]
MAKQDGLPYEAVWLTIAVLWYLFASSITYASSEPILPTGVISVPLLLLGGMVFVTSKRIGWRWTGAAVLILAASSLVIAAAVTLLTP